MNTTINNKGYEFDRIADIKRLDFILQSLQQSVPPGSSVLDVGCGNGVISRHLGKHGFNVFGIDVSEKTIIQAKALTSLPNVQFKVISAEQLVADGKKYDAVICSEVLEHLKQPSLLLKVLYDCLKDSGKLIVTVPNGKGPREVLVTKPVQKMQTTNSLLWRMLFKFKTMLGYSGATPQSAADDLSHIQFFSKKDLEQLSTNNQFKIVRFAKSNFVDDVFPFSLFTRRIKWLQKVDSKIADLLPYQFTGGFFSMWAKEK
ncbi:MAG: methyltransferase domain-containing protein [Chitinophagaceae bacterium]